ncbi:MAG: CPBP family intramembrane metalloprotease [Bryobacterales bacterium]|nr:CPBP family intramembrane metalloprotease [Bryobacterales bacterium]
MPPPHRHIATPPLLPASAGVAVAGIWVAAGVAAALLLPQHIPNGVRIPFFFAACLELGCFVPLGWERVRSALIGRFPPKRLAMGLVVSGLLPFLVYTLGAGVFTWQAAGTLAALCLAICLWYVLLPAGRMRDLGFLTLVAVVTLSGMFKDIYPDAAPKLQAEFLGRILWIRLGIAASLLLRQLPGTGFGWWPSLREWRCGALGFAALFPVLFVLGWWLQFFGLRELARPWHEVAAIALGTFFGIFWVVALSEEFFLRGLLQQWLVDWLGSFVWGIAATSLLSGALHLPFREFPNWKFALLATVAHAGYGWVFHRAGGIRAAMVTHALVVTAWRVFLV